MSDVTHGMNLDEVKALGQFLKARARDVGTLRATIDSKVSQSTWAGPDRDQFSNSWWPAHSSKLTALEQELDGLGQSALNNASEQRRASEAVSGGDQLNPCFVPGSTTILRTTSKSVGVGVENEYSVSTELVQGQDGRWYLTVVAGDRFKVDLAEYFKLAAIGAGGKGALSKLGNLGALVGFGSDGYTYVIAFPSKADAELLNAAIHERQANILDGGDRISSSDLDDLLDGLGISASDFELVGYSHAEAGSFEGGLSMKGIEFSGGAKPAVVAHGWDSESGSYLRSSTMTVGGLEGGIDAGAFGAGAGLRGEGGVSITVLTDQDGLPVQIVVERSMGTTFEGGASIGNSLYDILGIDTGVRETASVVMVEKETMSFSLDDPAQRQIFDGLLGPAGGDGYTKAELSELLRRAGQSDASLSVTEVYAGEGSSSESGFFMVSEGTSDRAELRLVSRSER